MNHENQALLIEKLQKHLATAQELYLKQVKQSNALRSEKIELLHKLKAFEQDGYSEAWVIDNPVMARHFFWQLWIAGADQDLDADSKKSIFLGILAGSDDISEDLIEELKREYA